MSHELKPNLKSKMPANYDVEISQKLNTCWDQYINVRTTGSTGCNGNFKNVCNYCKSILKLRK